MEAVSGEILLLLFVIPVPAAGQPYFSIGFGPNAASELESVRSGPEFGGSLCDGHMSPRYDELPECIGPPNPDGRAWISLFDRSAGVLGAAAIGYRAGGWLRGELEYCCRGSAYDQSSLTLRPSGEASERAGGDRLRSVGRPVIGVELRIPDHEENHLPTGATGEIVVRGPDVSIGYLDRPEESAAAFRDG